LSSLFFIFFKKFRRMEILRNIAVYENVTLTSSSPVIEISCRSVP